MKKVLVVVIVASVMLMGCAGALVKSATKEVVKINEGIAAYVGDKTVSDDCWAGFADGLMLAPDTNAAVRIAAEGMSKFADKGSPDYKHCYISAARISFVVRGGEDITDRILTQLITLGIMK